MINLQYFNYNPQLLNMIFLDPHQLVPESTVDESSHSSQNKGNELYQKSAENE